MALKKGKGLGKGLDSLIPSGEIKPASEVVAKAEVYVNITKIEPNREQPRKEFDEEALQELADSIKQYGVIEPLIVQDRKDYYEIIAGERRWRASRLAGLKEVPVIIKDYTEQEIVEISLIENIQREDLNPIEEALAYKRLVDEFNLKQDEVAKRVGKNRSTVTNSLRLLKLNENVQQMLINKEISPGHAKVLLVIESKEKQYEIARKVFDESLSVRDTEKIVKELDSPVKPKKVEKKETPEVMKILFQDIENNLRTILGVKVNIVPKDNNNGKIEIEYYSKEQLELFIDKLSQNNN